MRWTLVALTLIRNRRRMKWTYRMKGIGLLEPTAPEEISDHAMHSGAKRRKVKLEVRRRGDIVMKAVKTLLMLAMLGILGCTGSPATSGDASPPPWLTYASAVTATVSIIL